jgi:hypothetical protein
MTVPPMTVPEVQKIKKNLIVEQNDTVVVRLLVAKLHVET